MKKNEVIVINNGDLIKIMSEDNFNEVIYITCINGKLVIKESL